MIEHDDNHRCCGNCRFFFEEGKYRGQCRRYPPQAWSETNPETTSCLGFNFPDVRKEEWCGEHQREEGWVMPPGFNLTDDKPGAGAVYEIKD